MARISPKRGRFVNRSPNLRINHLEFGIKWCKPRNPDFKNQKNRVILISKSEFLTQRNPDWKHKYRKFRIFPICLRHVCPVCLTNHLCFPFLPPLPLHLCASLYYLGFYITNVGRVHNNTHVRRWCAFPGVQVRVRNRRLRMEKFHDLNFKTRGNRKRLPARAQRTRARTGCRRRKSKRRHPVRVRPVRTWPVFYFYFFFFYKRSPLSFAREKSIRRFGVHCRKGGVGGSLFFFKRQRRSTSDANL